MRISAIISQIHSHPRDGKATLTSNNTTAMSDAGSGEIDEPEQASERCYPPCCAGNKSPLASVNQPRRQFLQRSAQPLATNLCNILLTEIGLNPPSSAVPLPASGRTPRDTLGMKTNKDSFQVGRKRADTHRLEVTGIDGLCACHAARRLDLGGQPVEPGRRRLCMLDTLGEPLKGEWLGRLARREPGTCTQERLNSIRGRRRNRSKAKIAPTESGLEWTSSVSGSLTAMLSIRRATERSSRESPANRPRLILRGGLREVGTQIGDHLQRARRDRSAIDICAIRAHPTE